MVEQMTPPADGQAARILALVLRAGEILLANGAEVFRVHETMTIMAGSLGLAGYHDYVLTNGLFASADGTGLAAVRNVPSRSVHLGRVEAVNEISREIAAGALTLEEAERRLEEAAALPMPPAPAQVVASAAGSLCFAFLFGGTPAEGRDGLDDGSHGLRAEACQVGAVVGDDGDVVGAAAAPAVGLAQCADGAEVRAGDGVDIRVALEDLAGGSSKVLGLQGIGRYDDRVELDAGLLDALCEDGLVLVSRRVDGRCTCYLHDMVRMALQERVGGELAASAGEKLAESARDMLK